jgi:filamentous hemagglutinin
MKFSHAWKSLFQLHRPCLRRKKHSESFGGFVAAEILEHRELLSAAAPAVTLAVQLGSLTLTSTDINNPNVTFTRAGNSVIVAGANGTLITFGTTTAAVQVVNLPVLNNLTLNLGTGSDTVTISALGIAGNLTINGQPSGTANIAISAGSANAVVGGSIVANFGGEAATLGVYGSTNGGGNLTVNGSVNVTEAGSGNKQINIYGPPANNPLGGKLTIKGALSVLDTGTGSSGLRIDDGVTIGGNVSYDNSANKVGGDSVVIYSNSNAYGMTSIGGTLTLALSQSLYQSNSVLMEGFGNSMAVTGAVNITGGGGTDNIELANDWFKNTVNINTGSNPSSNPDVVSIDGSRFDGATTVNMSGPFAMLELGTNSTFGSTLFNSTFLASLIGASDTVLLSNATSRFNQVFFLSTATFIGGTPPATLLVQGNYFASPGKLTKVNFNTTTTAVVPNVTMTVQGGDVTLSSTDNFNPNITITRSGNNLVVIGNTGTVVTYGAKFAASQTIPIAAVNSLTVNLGIGTDTVSITGLGTTGNITINGQSSGTANISINAGSPNVVIGGSILANLGSEAATFGVFGSTNGGGSLTVNGSVSITEGGSGNKQVNIYGPPANNAVGGKLTIKGGIGVVDSGSGHSGLRIDDGVTIGGNVSYDNSANTTSGDNVVIFSNSNAYGTTSIGGALTLSLSQAMYQNNSVLVQGFGNSLVVTGAVTITGGAGADQVELANDWFKSAVTINTGSSPSFSPDIVSIDGSRFDSATTFSMSGPYAELLLGTNSTFASTFFNNTFAASLTGASATVLVSNATANFNQVVFISTAKFTGGTPFATLVIQGRYFVNPGKLTKSNFN